jgi:hypothetical protein
MLHACFTPLVSCFIYTLWHFYVFSGTNLLTRCNSASSLFSAIFVFQKSYTGNILRIGRNEDRNSYFSRTKDKDRKRAGGGLEGRLTRGWRAPILVVPGGGEAPWWPSNAASPPIKSLQTKNPKSIGVFPRTVPQRRRRRRQFLGDRSLCSGTLPGRGSAPGAISIGLPCRLCRLHRPHRHLHHRCCLL